MRRIIAILVAVMAVGLSAATAAVTVGAARVDAYMPLLSGKRVGLLSHRAGMVSPGVHTLDVMLREGVNVVTLFSPEHGFRGTADAGEHVDSSTDPVTGLPIASLYSAAGKGIDDSVMAGVDVIVVDLQDVGTRFYTYYITMISVIEQAAAAGRQVVVLDRPNPLGMMVDGPVLDMSLRSGVGRLPIPVAHGMTLGELALMAVGERWVAASDSMPPLINVVACEGYTHATAYELTVAPSPNLRSMTAIYLYPSLCYFEGTTASVGRGTDLPFMIYGHPDMEPRGFEFTPRSVAGAKSPPWVNTLCQGVDLSHTSPDSLLARGVDLSHVIDAYRAMPDSLRPVFFTPFFDKLIGTTTVRPMIEAGATADEIRATWAVDVARFREIRKKYLLYP